MKNEPQMTILWDNNSVGGKFLVSELKGLRKKAFFGLTIEVEQP